MPIVVRIDREARLIRAAVEGEVALEEMLATLVEAAGVVEREGQYHVVSDHRALIEPATPPQVEAMAATLAARRSAFAGTRWAVIAARPASVGMMRMLGLLAESVPMQVQVFEDPGEAERWARSGVFK